MTPGPTPAVLDEFEIATGSVLGRDPDVPALRAAPPGTTVRAALEAVALAALQRGPCVVSFSGGRDSSAVLAVATHVARREGLPLPVPVTVRVPGDVGADEDDWQQLVVAHLGLPDWERREFGDELDAVGPIATAALRRHGLLWPFNAYFHVPVFERATGGTVLTGVGGDQLLSAGLWHRENLLLTGRRRPTPLDAARVVLAHSPRPVRGRYLAARVGHGGSGRPWLTPDAEARAVRALRADLADDAVSHRASVRRVWWASRSRTVGQRSLDVLAADHDVVCMSPLAHRDVLAAVLRERGYRAFDHRSHAMTTLVGDLLPPALLTRSTKGGFGTVFVREPTRAFAARWDRTGLDPALVVPAVLQRIWTAPGPVDARTLSALQAAWWRTEGGAGPG